MLGWGLVKGLGVTLWHFGASYVEDMKYAWSRYVTKESTQSLVDYRMAPGSKGIYTIQYPEEKPVIPERFRFLPFLVTDYEGDEPEKRYEANRCTSCGICSKACPPQCIWIVRTTNEQGRPVPQPKEFYIDTDICMNCGYCAEFCPFDAIIMDHEYALADYERDVSHIHNLDRLLKPASYYQEIRPTEYAAKQEEKRLAAEEKQRKAEEKARKMAEKKAAAEAKKAAEDAAAAEGETKGDTDASAAEKPAVPARPKKTPEEIKAAREAMLAKRRAREEANQKEQDAAEDSGE